MFRYMFQRFIDVYYPKKGNESWALSFDQSPFWKRQPHLIAHGHHVTITSVWRREGDDFHLPCHFFVDFGVPDSWVFLGQTDSTKIEESRRWRDPLRRRLCAQAAGYKGLPSNRRAGNMKHLGEMPTSEGRNTPSLSSLHARSWFSSNPWDCRWFHS